MRLLPQGKKKGIRTFVHGDDYVSVGGPQHLDWKQHMLERKYQFKTQVLGPRESDVQQLNVLNRIFCCNRRLRICSHNTLRLVPKHSNNHPHHIHDN